MVQTMAVTMIRMNTIRTVFSIKRLLVPFLVLAALALFHAALVSSLLALGFSGAADAITLNNPDVAEAQARKYREQSLELEFAPRQEALTISLDYWQQAISARPLWPYYHLGALDAEVLLQDSAAVQKRIQHMIALAPNERGLDEGFLILAFIAWDWVGDAEKPWLLTRLGMVKRSTLRQVFSYAKQANNHRDICSHLPWKKVKRLCKQ